MPKRLNRGEAAALVARLSRPKRQSACGLQVLAARSTEDYRPEGATELTGREQYRVEIVLFSTSPKDDDNCYVKPLIDQLRYHKLLPDDNPFLVRSVLRQFKVKHRIDEGTKVVITKLYA